MRNLPTDLPRHYRYRMEAHFQFGTWKYSYEIIGEHGGAHLHVAGPHVYDGGQHWTAGLELHSRKPLYSGPPSHDKCWLIKCPCWHDGISSYAQDHFLPMHFAEDHGRIFREMTEWADSQFADRVVA